MNLILISILLFVSLIFFLSLGVPVSFAMGGISVILGFFLWGGMPSLDGFVLGSYNELTKSSLTALPFYIFMAAVLMYSDLADDMYEFVYRWFGNIRGGLAVGTTLVATIYGAMVGLSTVATATLGLVARPSMLKRNYDDKLTLGVIMAGGTLGLLIPPSIVMIVYATEAEISTGDLFMAGIMPGILASLIFCVYALVLCYFYPEKGPSLPKSERFSLKEKMNATKNVILPMVVILIVLGSIYLGVATPTEAGAVGVTGALVVAGLRRKLTLTNLKHIFTMTVRLNGMILWLLIGAVAYARIVTVTGVGQSLANVIVDANFSTFFFILLIIVVFLVLGMFMETVAILLITAPIFFPALIAMDVNLVWFGILFVISCCIGSLSPPFGITLFIMKGVANDLSVRKIYSAVWPFILMLLIVMALVIVFPNIALWLPNAIVK